MGGSEPQRDVRARHAQSAERFGALAADHERRANLISLGRLLTFLAAVVLLASAVPERGGVALYAGLACAAAFVALVALHARALTQARAAGARRAVHLRHLARSSGQWRDFEPTGAARARRTHPYAVDVDLFGPGSLFQRIDTTRTEPGDRLLADWLSEPADRQTIEARQRAARELMGFGSLRVELEARALLARGTGKLDAAPFKRFTEREPLVSTALALAAHALPLLTAAAGVAAWAGVADLSLFGLGLALQVVIVLATGGRAGAAFELIAARRGYVEAFRQMLTLASDAPFEDETLRSIQARIRVNGIPPARYLAQLDRWAGLAELRTQPPVHFFVNPLVLWDLNVLYRLERWNRGVGAGLADAFEALGALEALAAFASFADGDPEASWPTVESAPGERPGGDTLVATGLGHPLLLPEARVGNDLTLRGPGTALIVTGSNMAGKSTLLRALGLNVALALAGGPVTAAGLRLPIVRLRASMRVDDSLARGASYFHAELDKLRVVVADADSAPPVLFLLDELLRGTNARARHIGVRAVLSHLCDLGAFGVIATHDTALAALEASAPGRYANVHFTDVMRGGAMTFDYRLRPGVVRTSNALRLIAAAGIPVPDDPDGSLDDDAGASIEGGHVEPRPSEAPTAGVNR
ncbi:MAG: hypothetical protein KC543_11110 [Myxococcales bacterium]|nr:hypothetical protein [Myxococcales bacterium]